MINFFSFLCEDTVIEHVEYHFNEGKILEAKPDSMFVTLTNEGTQIATLSANMQRTAANTCPFQKSEGFSLKVGVEMTIGVPGVASGKISTDITTSTIITWGHSKSVSKKMGSNVSVPVPGRCEQKVEGTVTANTISVPCTVYSKSVKTGVEVITKSVYSGVSVSDYRYVVLEAKPIKGNC